MKKKIIIVTLICGLFIREIGFAQEQPLEIQQSTGDAQNIYISQEGDTLWDVCDMFFENPWYWPVLWSFNPHITNPHWIFPGDIVYLTPPASWASVPKRPNIATEGKTRIEEKEKYFGRKVGFISDKKYKQKGIIKNSFEEKVYLGEFDEVYLKFENPKKVRKGDRFLIYRVVSEVKHPFTGEWLGYKIRYLGISGIISTAKPLVKAVISESYEEMVRGDLLTDYSIIARTVVPIKNQHNLDATIVDTMSESTWLGEYDYIIVDKGKKSEVVPGNRFIIKTKGDGNLKLTNLEKKEFPYEDLGEILIVETHDETSLGVLTYSRVELAIGDYCVMIQGY